MTKREFLDIVFALAPTEANAIMDAFDEYVDSNEPHWIPVTERLPEDNIPVNVTWVNRNPESYYSDIKDKPYTATAVYFRGKWFWYSCVIEDWLAEYGSNESLLANLQEAVDRDIEIVAWMPLPEPYKGVTE
mgnify:CR=1 FL=1